VTGRWHQFVAQVRARSARSVRRNACGRRRLREGDDRPRGESQQAAVGDELLEPELVTDVLEHHAVVVFYRGDEDVVAAEPSPRRSVTDTGGVLRHFGVSALVQPPQCMGRRASRSG